MAALSTSGLYSVAVSRTSVPTRPSMYGAACLLVVILAAPLPISSIPRSIAGTAPSCTRARLSETFRYGSLDRSVTAAACRSVMAARPARKMLLTSLLGWPCVLQSLSAMVCPMCADRVMSSLVEATPSASVQELMSSTMEWPRWFSLTTETTAASGLACAVSASRTRMMLRLSSSGMKHLSMWTKL
ncbi:hypothetical protein EE612_013416 [Oryza sativa]|nr:hypothetical protein EE612_013416 [Oryza sativa]